MGFEPMNNGFAGRRVSHFATRAHRGHIPTPKTQNPLRLAVGSTETCYLSTNPECQNERVRSNSNTCWRNGRSFASFGSWVVA